MKIEKTYLAEFIEKTIALDQEYAQKESADIDTYQMYLEKIIESVAAEESKGWEYHRPWQKWLFNRFSNQLMSYAKNEAADIVIESDAIGGSIQLECTEVLFHLHFLPEHRRLWRSLIKYADTVSVFPSSKYDQPILQYTFEFKFRGRFGGTTE